MKLQHYIFLSPHLDDVALSCGGLVWDLAREGHRVEIWTLMAGFPPDEDYSAFAQQNHHAWGKSGEEAIRMRLSEDGAACEVLNAAPRHFHWPDAIYRRDPHSGEPIVMDKRALFSRAPEPHLVDAIRAMLASEVPDDARLIAPLGLGGHIDHQAVVRAVELSRPTGFVYGDYPYILDAFDRREAIWHGLTKLARPLGEQALEAWQESVLCYASQISVFWRAKTEVRLALRNYLAGGGGRLWQNGTGSSASEHNLH